MDFCLREYCEERCSRTEISRTLRDTYTTERARVHTIPFVFFCLRLANSLWSRFHLLPRTRTYIVSVMVSSGQRRLCCTAPTYHRVSSCSSWRCRCSDQHLHVKLLAVSRARGRIRVCSRTPNMRSSTTPACTKQRALEPFYLELLCISAPCTHEGHTW